MDTPRQFFPARYFRGVILKITVWLLLLVALVAARNLFPSPSFSPVESDRQDGMAETHYRNCAEARAAGAAPIHVGEPGYAPWLDADNDGIACEPWRR